MDEDDCEIYGDDAQRLKEYAEKKYGPEGSQTRKMDPEFEGDAT